MEVARSMPPQRSVSRMADRSPTSPADRSPTSPAARLPARRPARPTHRPPADRSILRPPERPTAHHVFPARESDRSSPKLTRVRPKGPTARPAFDEFGGVLARTLGESV